MYVKSILSKIFPYIFLIQEKIPSLKILYKKKLKNVYNISKVLQFFKIKNFLEDITVCDSE